MKFRQTPREREANAESRLRGARLPLCEEIEHARQQLPRNPDAGIRPKWTPAAGHRSPAGDGGGDATEPLLLGEFAALWSRFERIWTNRVGSMSMMQWSSGSSMRNSIWFGSHRRTIRLNRAPDQSSEQGRFPLHRDFAGGDSRHVQEVVD